MSIGFSEVVCSPMLHLFIVCLLYMRHGDGPRACGVSRAGQTQFPPS